MLTEADPMALHVDITWVSKDLPLRTSYPLQCYCLQEGQDIDLCYEVLQSVGRYEIYVFDGKYPIAGTYVIDMLDMHHGNVAALAALWVHKDHRKGGKVQRLLMRGMYDVCKRLGVTKYQRSRHLSPNQQLIITKEVPFGIH